LESDPIYFQRLISGNRMDCAARTMKVAGIPPASEVAEMTTRTEYVAGLKKQLDAWNADMARWEAKAKDAQAGIQERYQRELAVLNAQRELAVYNLQQLEGASLDAWAELRQGVDDAWDRMRLAAAAAGTCFEPLAKKVMKAKAGTRKPARSH
jgi:hypothetical protein